MIRDVRRVVGRRVLDALGRNEADWKVALAFAIGVAISFSPFLGLHWILGLAVASVFRLNKVDVLLATIVPVNPWTVIPVYTAATAFGWFVLHAGQGAPAIAQIRWHDISFAFWRSPGLAPLKPLLPSFLVGSLIFSLVASLLTYFILVTVIRIHRRRRSAALAHPSGSKAEI